MIERCQDEPRDPPYCIRRALATPCVKEEVGSRRHQLARQAVDERRWQLNLWSAIREFPLRGRSLEFRRGRVNDRTMRKWRPHRPRRETAERKLESRHADRVGQRIRCRQVYPKLPIIQHGCEVPRRAVNPGEESIASALSCEAGRGGRANAWEPVAATLNATLGYGLSGLRPRHWTRKRARRLQN